MGMDIFGCGDAYFRASIWQWRALCHAMELAGYDLSKCWTYNNGAGLDNTAACEALADRLADFLKSWDGDILVREDAHMRVDDTGRFVAPGTPGSHSAYWIRREHIGEFVTFLRNCGGHFEIW